MVPFRLVLWCLCLCLCSVGAVRPLVIQLPVIRPPCIYPAQVLHVRDQSLYLNTPLVPSTRREPIQSQCQLWAVRSARLQYVNGSTLVARHKHCLYNNQPTEHLVVLRRCGHRRERVRIPVLFAHPQLTQHSSDRLKRRKRQIGAERIQFTQESYQVNVTEEQPAGQIVIQMVAVHQNGLPLFYSMIAPEDSRSSQMLSIDRDTGVIRTSRALDRETLAVHKLRVKATEQGNPTIHSEVMLTIDVLDVQDNRPQFDRGTYTNTVPENVPLHTTVLHVYAHDKDAGHNADVRYTKEDETQAPEFRLDPESGQIVIIRPLDRERTESYRFKVVATDRGSPQPMTDTSVVVIEVADVNDNYPQFTESRYRVSVAEDVTVPHELVQVRATDMDVGDNGRVRYSIVDAGDMFTVNYETGLITLTKPLVYSTANQLITMTIRALDAGVPSLSNTTTIEVTVLDVNDHAPQFYTNKIQQILAENVEVGTEVAVAEARDGDSGRNALVSYSMKATGTVTDLPFDIDSTGRIVTNQLLDHELYESVLFDVIATDHGEPPQSSSLSVSVQIRDINDNAPEFEHKFYNVSVLESAPVGSHLLSVRAHDKDSSGTVSYELTAGNGLRHFALKGMADHAALMLQHPLHYNTNHKYSLTVRANDQQLSDIATIEINVVDENSRPQFVDTPLRVSVSEAALAGSTVAHATAVDSDADQNALLGYSLRSGTDHFHINNTTGVITLIAALDRELKATHSLKVTAQDHGTPPLAAHTEIEVVVDDVNDNAPEFEGAPYALSISEDANVGTSFVQVTANDQDAGANGRLIYSLLSDGNPDGTFQMDATSGTLRLSKALDRETIAEYILTIQVTDHGVPPLSSTAQLHVTVTDVNDNPPRFAESTVHLYVAENSPIGTLVDELQAVDADEGTNAHIKYTIFDGDDMSAFELVAPQANGRHKPHARWLLTRVQLDYEVKNEYHLQVQASSGDLKSLTDLIVHVTDENDHEPVLQDFVILITSEPHKTPASPFARVPAFDPDVNTSLSFYIEPNQLLFVDAQSGQLSLAPHLSTNRQLESTQKICVTDGPNMVCASCQLILLTVDSDLLLQSVSLRMVAFTRDQLLSPLMYTRLRDALASIGPYPKRNVLIFDVRESAEGESHTQVTVTVSFSVQRTNTDQFVSARELQERVHMSVGHLSGMMGVRVQPVPDDVCVREPCANYEQCSNTLRLVTNSENAWYITDNFLFRPMTAVDAFTCVCPPGFASENSQQSCNLQVNLCHSSPCLHNGTCLPSENSYTCVCPKHTTGANCEFKLRDSFCAPQICSGSSQCQADSGQVQCNFCPFQPHETNRFCELHVRSFSDGAYITLPTIKARTRFQFSISISTIQPNALLLYNGRYEGKNDFVALMLREGLPEFVYSISNRTRDTRRLIMPDTIGNRLNDGQWHTIHVAYHAQRVVMSVDNCDRRLALHFSDQLEYPKCAVQTPEEQLSSCAGAQSADTCHRFLDLTGPLHIGSMPARVQPFTQSSTNYDGCVRQLILDGRLIDLSDTALTGNVGSQTGCNRRPLACDSAPCLNGARCTDVWLGYKCECAAHYSGQNCENDGTSAKQLLQHQRGFVIWTVPGTQPLELSLGIPFRTRQSNAQLLVVQFDVHDRHLIIKIVDSRIVVELNELMVVTDYPKVSDARWHDVNVQLHARTLSVTVDHLHVYTSHIQTDIVYSPVSQVFIGAYTNSSLAQPFIGCVKDVYFGPKAEHLKVQLNYQVQGGNCNQENKCFTENTCPEHSDCVQDWDTVRCDCHKGFTGARCMEVCSQPLVCANGGQCVNGTGTDQHCACTDGHSGKYCEQTRPPANEQCPDGWWGSPMCGPCQCDTGLGLASACDKTTGKCSCKADHYRQPGSQECVPCDCWHPAGAQSTQCHPVSGQCRCRGQAQGRQCNQCADRTHEFNSVTGICSPHHGHCPAVYEHSLWWKATALGKTHPNNCPHGARGLVSRVCGIDGRWKVPEMSNCTAFAFDALTDTLSDMERKGSVSALSVGNTGQLALRLRNATLSDVAGVRLYGKDVYTTYGLLMALLNAQMANATPQATSHINHKMFTADLISTAGAVLDESLVESWTYLDNQGAIGGAAGKVMNLVHHLDKYGKALADIHESTHLRAFIVAHHNLLFAIDHLDRADGEVTLPKFDQFLVPDRLNLALRKVAIKVKGHVGAVFYSVYPQVANLLPCLQQACVRSVIVSFASATPLQHSLQISLPLLPSAKQSTDPRCVWWNAHTGSWSRHGCALIGYNSTYVQCECDHQSTYAVLMDNKQQNWPLQQLTRTVAACLSVLVLVCSMARLLERKCRGLSLPPTHSIQFMLAASLIAHIIAYYFVIMARYHLISCQVISAVLHLSVLCASAWLFVYALHVYRSVTDYYSTHQPISIQLSYVLIGCVLPVVLVTITAILNTTNQYSDLDIYSCWISVHSSYAWTMLIPVSLFAMLAAYIAITCYLVSLHKEWDMLLMKLRLRRTLTAYSLVHLCVLVYFSLAWSTVNLNLFEHQNLLVDTLQVAVAVFMLVWSCTNDEHLTEHDQTRAMSLWMSSSQPQTKPNITLREDDHYRTVQQPLRSDSPCLAEHLAPRDEEEFSEHPNDQYGTYAFGQHGQPSFNYAVYCQSLVSAVDNQSPVKPSQTGIGDFYNGLHKPDVIPSWEDRLPGSSSSAAPLDSPDTQMSNGSTTTGVASSGYHSGMSSASGFCHAPNRHPPATTILSPVQKVLFTGGMDPMSLDTEQKLALLTPTGQSQCELSPFSHRSDTLQSRTSLRTFTTSPTNVQYPLTVTTSMSRTAAKTHRYTINAHANETNL